MTPQIRTQEEIDNLLNIVSDNLEISHNEVDDAIQNTIRWMLKETDELPTEPLDQE